MTINRKNHKTKITGTFFAFFCIGISSHLLHESITGKPACDPTDMTLKMKNKYENILFDKTT